MRAAFPCNGRQAGGAVIRLVQGGLFSWLCDLFWEGGRINVNDVFYFSYWAVSGL